jgi:hypothetical protein
MSDFEKIHTPRGEARSMTTLSPTSISVGYGGDSGGSNWFGPAVPMRPIAPAEVAGRVWDFMPGFNLVSEPRANEPVTFAMLRTLSEAYDPVRIIIERRKDQMCRLPWTIRARHDGAGRRPSAAALSPSVRSLMRDVSEFVKRPTLELSFREWLRMILEDHFVIDAVALHCERSYSGAIVGLQPVDGATIKRVIDDYGRTPRPIPWNGRPINWNGLLITGDNAAAQGFKLLNGFLMPPAYQQILHGLPAVSLTTQDLIYRMLNVRTHRPYGFSPVEQIVTTVGAAIGRTASQISYTREGNQPEAIYGMPDNWSASQVQAFQDYWDNLHIGNMGARRRMKFLPAGTNSAYTALKEPPLKAEFDEWLIRIICAAFSFPPAAFVSLQNRSVAEAHERQAEAEGLESTKTFIADLVNGVVSGELADDNIEFAWLEEDETNQAEQSKILTRYAESGVLTINQCRQRLGEELDPSPAANKLMVKTATGYVPIDGGAAKQ